MLDEMPSALSGAWDTALLAPIAEINQALLEALRTAALDPSRTRLPRLLLTLRADWGRLDQAALERAAACPYLLLDAGLAQPSFGESPLRGVMDAPMSGRTLAGIHPRWYRAQLVPAFLTRPEAVHAKL